jgi:hypothetical protein
MFDIEGGIFFNGLPLEDTSLRVCVDHNNAIIQSERRSSEIDCEGGFSNPAFAIDQTDDHYAPVHPEGFCLGGFQLIIYFYLSG